MPKSPAPRPTPAVGAPVAPAPWYRQRRAILAGRVTVAVLALGLLYWFLAIHPYVSTDDARVAATLVRVAPQGAGGRIAHILVVEGDTVKAGQVLVQLDPDSAAAQLQRAQAKALLARREFNRAEQMAAQHGVSARQLDEARANTQAADADERLAQLALDRCTLRSPIDGLVVQKAAEEGNQIETGQTAVTVADLEHAWIAANVEETDVGRLKAGQPVTVQVDEGGALKGRLDEVRFATLSTFSLIPAESSSGNFIKLVQRVPVKVLLDPHPGRDLRVGESVEIKVRVR